MPVIQANKISYQFDNGDRLFSDISCSLSDKRVGLVGRNGVGKSLLAGMLTKKHRPTSGSVVINATHDTYSQQPSQWLMNSTTVADYLGVTDKITALQHIENGDCDDKWFEMLADDWTIKQRLSQQLAELGLPREVNFPCSKLSGGQLARLQLWRLFNSEVDLLVLDEPSNHLDGEAKAWLIEKMAQFSGHILLISHDRQLLRQMDQIWELSQLGLVQYGGNYDVYSEQKQRERNALERQIEAVRGEQKKLEVQAQRNHEKAQQREAQGNKLRKSGSQSKLILDGMKDSATASLSNRLKNDNNRRTMLAQKHHALSGRYEQITPQKIYLEQGEASRAKRLNIVSGILPFGSRETINLILEGNSRLHLCGGNGSGKSTLLKVLRGDICLESGELKINHPVCYLDQHFGLINESHSILDNLMEYCSGIIESDARTLLAGIGFRRDTVYRQASLLSGGEKMKLAMLIASHQPLSPILLLDEPDNHLDLDSKQLLAEALRSYQGAFILVSHDDDFVNESGVTQRYTLVGEGG